MGEPYRKPDPFDRAWDAWCRAAIAPIGENHRASAALVATVAVGALLLATSPALFLNDNALDIFVPLDGAWRMEAGQRPHLDFMTPIGALYYALLDLAGPSAKAPIYASLILLPVTLGFAFVATRDRLPTPLRLGLVAMVAMLTISPRTLDHTGLISHLASYNRHSWAFLLIVACGVLLEPRSRTRAEQFGEGAVLALSTVALFYLKVTWFALGGALLILGALFGGPNRPLSLGAGIASLAVVAAGFAVGETNAAYLADLRAAAAAGADSSSGLLRTDRLLDIFHTNLVGILGLFAGVVALLRTAASEAEEQIASNRSVRLLAMLALAGLVTSQAHDHTIPLLPLLAAGVFLVFRERWERHGGSELPLRLTGALALALMVQPTAWDAFAIVRHAAASRSPANQALADIPGSPVREVRIPGPPEEADPLLDRVIQGTLPPDAYDNLDVKWNEDNPRILADAVALLEAHGQRSARVGSLTFSPSFPWMLGTPPPRRWPAWHDYQRTFTAADADQAAAVLVETDAVLVPRVWRIEGIVDAYGPALAKDFEEVGSTPLWTLWVRR